MFWSSGQLSIYRLDEGKELTLYRLFERDTAFSASCVLSVQFNIMVSAETDSEVYLIPSPLYKTLMESSIAVANYTSEPMASHFGGHGFVDKIMNKARLAPGRFFA